MGRLPLDGLDQAGAERAVAALVGVERGDFFGPDGRQVAVFEGDANRIQVPLTAGERRAVRGGVFVHNHPEDEPTSPDDPLRGFLSFSPSDVVMARAWDLEELVAVTRTWRFSLRRPAQGWSAIYGDGPIGGFEDMLLTLWAVTAEQDERLATPERRQRLRVTRADRVAERFAAEIGATYRRERR